MGMSYFLVQKSTHVIQVSCFSDHNHLFLLLEALQCFGSLLEVLEVCGMVWKVLEGFAGFGGFCEAMRSFEVRG